MGDDGVGIRQELDMDNPESFGLDPVTLLVERLHGEITFDGSTGTTYRIRLRRARSRSVPE